MTIVRAKNVSKRERVLKDRGALVGGGRMGMRLCAMTVRSKYKEKMRENLTHTSIQSW